MALPSARSRAAADVRAHTCVDAGLIGGAGRRRAGAAAAGNKPIKMVVLGDSLSAGLGLPAADAFPATAAKSIERQWDRRRNGQRRGVRRHRSGGRDRLDWSVPEGTEAVILELGANDALRGTDPEVTRAALSDILTRLKARRHRGTVVRDAGAAELWQRLCGALQRHLSGAGEIVRRAALSVLPRRRRRAMRSSTRPTACIRRRRAST